jgi:hypothetical protein
MGTCSSVANLTVFQCHHVCAHLLSSDTTIIPLNLSSSHLDLHAFSFSLSSLNSELRERAHHAQYLYECKTCPQKERDRDRYRGLHMAWLCRFPAENFSLLKFVYYFQSSYDTTPSLYIHHPSMIYLSIQIWDIAPPTPPFPLHSAAASACAILLPPIGTSLGNRASNFLVLALCSGLKLT